MGRDLARHIIRGLNPQKNIALPNEMKPISSFGLGIMFFARFV